MKNVTTNVMMMLATSVLVLGSASAFAADTAPAKAEMGGVKTASASAPLERKSKKHGKKKEVKPESEAVKQ